MDDLVLRTVEIAHLYDLYKGLLTERQRDVLHLRLVEDLSLAEVAEELSVTRQAVHDTWQRTVTQMREYEDILGLRSDQLERGKLVEEILSLLDDKDGSTALIRAKCEAILSIGR
ncbi:MAG: hypothetical protein OWU32_09965 [Firmicutes bacterium]|nr:hypothetical protein [Bacillota bacterium]